MENTLLIGLSRQATLARQLDVIANNLANVRTSGYKSESMMFEEFLMPTARVDDMTGQDQNLSYVIDSGLARDFTTGMFETTGNELDVALEGEGWMVVETPAGERYTRNGEFSLNSEGELVNSSGHRVLGDGGPIVFTSEDTSIVIAADGIISSSSGEKGKLRIVEFEIMSSLSKEGENLYSSSTEPTAAQFPRVAQGMIERSNVQPVLETARMIEVTRAYVSNAKMMEKLEELRRTSLQTLAAVPV